jgi:hypothetical protein
VSELFLEPRPAALDPLPAGYHALFDRLLAVVEPDERIRAMWLSGSLARGVADAGSDLDVVLAVRDDDFAEFAASWREWLATVTPTVLARPLPQAAGCFYSTTSECLRLDVITEPVAGLPDTPHRRRLVVLDRDELDAVVPDPATQPGPNRERMAALVEEFLRQHAIFPAMVAREDWLCVAVGVQQAQTMLYQLFVEANQPLPPMGVKQWSAKLTPGQRAVLEGLPGPSPQPGSVIPAMQATAAVWRSEGRSTLEAHGVDWPAELDDAVARHCDRELGAD